MKTSHWVENKRVDATQSPLGTAVEGFAREAQGRSDLGDGVGVTGTHRLEEGGGFGSGGVGRQVEAAQRGQRAARVALGGGKSLCNCKSV